MRFSTVFGTRFFQTDTTPRSVLVVITEPTRCKVTYLTREGLREYTDDGQTVITIPLAKLVITYSEITNYEIEFVDSDVNLVD